MTTFKIDKKDEHLIYKRYPKGSNEIPIGRVNVILVYKYLKEQEKCLN